MKEKTECINAGCDAIVDEFLQKITPNAQWMVLEEMAVDVEKLGRKSTNGPKTFAIKQGNALKTIINNGLGKRAELKNANLIRSVKSNKEAILLWSTKVQILLAIMKFSPCHNATEIASEGVNETKKIKKAIDDLIKEYAHAYEIDVSSEIKKVEEDIDVQQSLDLLIAVFRRTIDALLVSLSVSLKSKQEDVEDMAAVEDTLADGAKNNDIKPTFYKKITSQTRSIVQKMKHDIAEQRKEIEELKTSKAGLEELVAIDELTRISNRRSYEERFDLEIKRMKRKMTPLYLLLIDIDDFKKINDTYGHKAGDKILITIAQELKSSIREIDFVARWGGEEFAVLCPETNSKGAANIAEKLRETIETYEFTINYKVKGQEGVVKKERIHVTISLGGVGVLKGQDVEAAFNLADEALYQAKEQGKNRVVMHSKYTEVKSMSVG